MGLARTLNSHSLLESLATEDGGAVVDGARDGEGVGVVVRTHHRLVSGVGDVSGAPNETALELGLRRVVCLPGDGLDPRRDCDGVDGGGGDTWQPEKVSAMVLVNKL